MECNYCQEKFTRREHLERHLRRHSGARPYACPLCSRSFSRRDTLSRHVATHGAEAQGLLARARGAGACQACSKDKVKCSGGNPCDRCQNRGQDCVQKNRNRNRPSNGRSRSEDWHNQAHDSDSDIPTANVIDDAAHISSPAAQLPSGQSTFQFNAATPNGLQGGQPAFTPIDNVSWTGLNMCADFPWTLDYASFFPESYPGFENSALESAVQLDYFPFPFALGTPVSQNHEGPLSTEESSTLASSLSQQREQRQGLPAASNSSHILAAQLTDDDITVAENFCHIRTNLNDAYQEVLAFYAQQTDPRFRAFPFPQPSVFNSFIQLYYEYFDDQLSFIHPSLLEQNDTPWILALAVASIGCQYTKASKRYKYASMLTELLRLSIPIDALKSRGYDTMVLAQCTLLLVVNLMCTGFKDNVVNLPAYRAWLATLMRRFVISSTNKDSLLSTEMNKVQSQSQWQSWILCESARRLTYCFAVVDSLSFILLGVEISFTAGDYEQNLPSSDKLWKARNEREWEKSLGFLNGQADPMSLSQIFSMNWTSSGVLQQLSQFNKLVLLVVLFVEESRAINTSRSCALSDFNDDDQGASSSTPPPLISYSRLDWKYKLLAPDPFSLSSYSGNPDNRNTFYHLLTILRHVSRKQLYASSGWYASAEEMTAAESCLFGWMSNNPAHSRECVVHAGALISEIRSTSITACYHSFCLLIAVSYLWAFTRFQYSGLDVNKETSSPQAPAQVLRIDQSHDQILRQRWVQTGAGVYIYVTGVGILSNQGSAERLWKEFLQIIGSRTGWPTLREGMVRCTCAVLNNCPPARAMRNSDSEVPQ